MTESKYFVRFGAPGAFEREKLPNPLSYYLSQGHSLERNGLWRNTLCPFHPDTKPSLSINIETGGFKCFACDAHGRDVLAYHRLRYGLGFKQAAQALGAWRGL